MPESVFDRTPSLRDQRSHSFKDPCGIVRMQALHPEVRIFHHLPFGESHYRFHISAHERASIIASDLIGVHNSWRYREQVLQPPTRLFQFGGTFLDSLFQFIVGLLEVFLLPFALA
jgi:hypothetical protein